MSEIAESNAPKAPDTQDTSRARHSKKRTVLVALVASVGTALVVLILTVAGVIEWIPFTGTPKKPVRLTSKLVDLLEVSPSVPEFADWIEFKVYNGTDWNISSIDVSVTITPESGISESRVFRLVPYTLKTPSTVAFAKPLDESHFNCEGFPNFLLSHKEKKKWTTDVVSAFGWHP